MARRLLVLGAGPAQLGALAAARAQGLEVIACDRDPQATGFAYADRRALVSTEDEQGIDRLAQACAVDGILSPGSDWPVAIAARVAARLGLPHPLAPDVAALTVSKLRQRERFAAAGVPFPRFLRVGTLDAAREAARELGGDVVVKAPDRQGQRGLAVARSSAELERAVPAAIAASRSRCCLVEELVAGPEVTVNGFLSGGVWQTLTVTDRETAAEPAFGVALAHRWPARKRPGLDRAPEVAAAATRALGIEGGPVYVQLVLGPGGPVVIELAARLGGGHDAELCELALGVDLNGLAIGAALGESVAPTPPEPQVGGACVRFLVAREGELIEVRGLESARTTRGVVAVHVYRAPGLRIGPLRTGGDRAGAVIASGASTEEALAQADAAAAALEFHVR